MAQNTLYSRELQRICVADTHVTRADQMIADLMNVQVKRSRTLPSNTSIDLQNGNHQSKQLCLRYSKKTSFFRKILEDIFI